MLRRGAPLLLASLIACQVEPPATPVLTLTPPSPEAPRVAPAPPAPAPIDVPPENPRLELALGRAFGCLLDRSGAVHCWGSNDSGQLGGAGLRGVTAIGAGPDHACAARANDIVCWGKNDHGQLGDGTRDDRRRPVVARALGVAGGHINQRNVEMALTRDSSCFFWSEEYSGSFAACTGARRRDDAFTLTGRGPMPPCPPRSLCAKLYGVRGVAHDTTLCTLSADAIPRVACPSGPPALVPSEPDPSVIAGLDEDRSEDFRQLAVGRAFACALQYDGDVACWGSNARGQLGWQAPAWTRDPRRVHAVHRAAQLCTGAEHACARNDDGHVRCWGDARRGQLGNVDVAAGLAVEIEEAAGAATIGCGEAHTCAAFTDGRVVCWGANESGQVTGAQRSAIASPTVVTMPR